MAYPKYRLLCLDDSVDGQFCTVNVEITDDMFVIPIDRDALIDSIGNLIAGLPHVVSVVGTHEDIAITNVYP
jgi:hypothetical protein